MFKFLIALVLVSLGNGVVGGSGHSGRNGLSTYRGTHSASSFHLKPRDPSNSTASSPSALITSLASHLTGADSPASYTLFSTTSYLSSSQLFILSNSTHSLISFNFSAAISLQFGWVGIGFGGESMTGAEQIVMGWPDPGNAGSWILSNRKATGHSVPQPLPAGSNDPILLTDLSSSPSSLSFLIPLNRSASAQFIQAFSSNKVETSDPNTMSGLSQHDSGRFGGFQANLVNLAGFDAEGNFVGNTGTTNSSSGSNSSSQPMTNYDRLIILHAIVASTAWLIISPLAVLIGRLGRNLGKTWFNLHWTLQVLLTTVLTCAAVTLGVFAAGIPKGSHQVMGFVILGLVCCQITLGWWIHKKLDPERKKRPIRNIAHICLGLSISLLGYVQVHSGLKLYSQSRSLPSYIFTIYWILAIAPLFIYLCSLICLVGKRRQDGMTWGFSMFGLGREGGDFVDGKIVPFDLESQKVEKEPSEKGIPTLRRMASDDALSNTSGATMVAKESKLHKSKSKTLSHTESFGNKRRDHVEMFNKGDSYLQTLQTIQDQPEYSDFYKAAMSKYDSSTLNGNGSEQDLMRTMVVGGGLKQLGLGDRIGTEMGERRKVYDPMSQGRAPQAKQFEKFRDEYDAAENDMKQQRQQQQKYQRPQSPPQALQHYRNGGLANRSKASTPTLINHSRNGSSASSNSSVPQGLNHNRQMSSSSINSYGNVNIFTRPQPQLSMIQETLSDPTSRTRGSLDFYANGVRNSIMNSRGMQTTSPLGMSGEPYILRNSNRPPRERPPTKISISSMNSVTYGLPSVQ